MIFYLLLVGHVPFNGKSHEVVIEKITNGKLDFETEDLKKLPEEAIDLLKQLLEFDFKKRITAEKALSHKYFAENMEETSVNDIFEKRISNLEKFKV